MLKKTKNYRAMMAVLIGKTMYLMLKEGRLETIKAP